MKEITITHTGKETAVVCNANIRGRREGLLLYLPIEICALATVVGTIDEEFVESNGIDYVKLGNDGGCIVAFPGNIEIGYFSKDLNDTFLERVTENVMEFLKGKGLNATRDNNDILINETYKVFSTSKANYNHKILFGAIHVSINCDAELVDKICTKPMNKIPKGLSEYGITSDEMLDLIIGIYEAETPNI